MSAPARTPQNLEAEQAVLGGVLLRASALNECIDLPLAPEDFFKPAHEGLYRAMVALADSGRPIDTVTLLAELRRAGRENSTGGLAYLSELQARVPTAENIGYWARLVAEASQMRSLILAVSQVQESANAWTGDVQQFLDESEARIFSAVRERSRSPILDGRRLMQAVTATMTRRAESPDDVPGVPTGIAEYDRRTGGLHPGELTIIAARPSVGKTSLAVNLVLNVCLEAKLPALVFSLEMSSAAIGERLVCSAARVDTVRARTGSLNGEEWARAYASASRIAGAPFRLDDNATSTVRQIRARARRFRADRSIFPAGTNLGVIVVDYLQLVKLGQRSESRDQEVGEVTLQLKALSKELGLPVVALAQLNRRAEDREGPPRLADLRESGAIEQHADNVAFLHRPKQRAEDGPVWGIRTDLILAKQRNGPMATCPLLFTPESARFVALEAGPSPATSAPASHRPWNETD